MNDTNDGPNRTSGARSRAARVAGPLVFVVLALLGLAWFVLTILFVTSDDKGWWIAVAVLFWAPLIVLAAAGPQGREEAHRILETPRDERERAIRSRAFGISFAAMMLFCAGWFALCIVDDRESVVPMLALAFGLCSVVACIEFLRRRG